MGLKIDEKIEDILYTKELSRKVNIMRYSKLHGNKLYQFALQKLKSCSKMPRKLKKRLGKLSVASFYISYQFGESVLPYLCGK